MSINEPISSQSPLIVRCSALRNRAIQLCEDLVDRVKVVDRAVEDNRRNQATKVVVFQ